MKGENLRLFTHRFDRCLFDERIAKAKLHTYWSPAELRDMALQIASAMSYLCQADPPIHHCYSDKDIFLVEKDGAKRYLVGDFGLTPLLTATFSEGVLGERGFVDARLLKLTHHRYNTVADRNHSHMSEQTDVFAFGMVLYTILGLRRPFELEPNPNDCVRQGMKVEDLGLSKPYHRLVTLYEACTQPSEQLRPAFRDIIVSLEGMKNLETVAEKMKPTLNRAKTSFIHHAVQASGPDELIDPDADTAISLPIHKLAASGKLLMKAPQVEFCRALFCHPYLGRYSPPI